MAKRNVAACRLCRRQGVKLFLKGSRCDSPKCGIERRNYPPGQHGWRRGKRSEYAIRLREKQTAKRYYQVDERRFQSYFREAARGKGHSGKALFELLERRLDNVVYRSGLALARRHARQLVAHGHVFLNGRRVNRPGCLVRVGDVIRPEPKESIVNLFRSFLEQTRGRDRASWIAVQEDPPEAKVVSMPPADQLGAGFQPQLIIELCSR